MVIDLGEARDAPVVDPPRWSRRRRRTAAAVVAVIALLAAVGAASPVRGGLVDVTIPVPTGTGFTVDGDALFLTTPDAAVVDPGERTIAMYRLPEARLAWKVSLNPGGPLRWMSVVDGMLLVLMETAAIETVAIRTDTGQVLWRRPGWFEPRAAGTVLMGDYRPGERANRIESVAVRDGAPRWSLTIPADDTVTSTRGRLVRWATSGQAWVYDDNTGTELASAKLPAADPQSAVQVVGDVLLIAGWDGERPIVTAYDLDRLERRWQADVNLELEFVSGECGQGNLCVSRSPNGVRVLDAATGRTRWGVDGWGSMEPLGPYLIAYGLEDPPRVGVLDPANGHEVADFGQWQTPRLAGPRVLGVRPEPSTNRAWVGWLDADARRTVVLGVATDVFGCAVAPSAVVCRRGDGSVGVWAPRRKL
ncbi:PQQ-like beta-propeller repeat protein [Phytohabitans rumicis]|uniref:Pyrrolo-quinoline quinone repeat domain-containing protein n=1 Tax=Phytohabitans rumicis TaxID=1076125 RepID=A0A6V8KUN6_9ACTN|nr:PQQ-like beta-propeller repeat protein [Phytohabitans rumicis]GFJ88772.1 hypothetical protein Prum_024140 [Phytohabitans rumicis]